MRCSCWTPGLECGAFPPLWFFLLQDAACNDDAREKQKRRKSAALQIPDARPSLLLVEIEIAFSSDERKHFTDLLEADAQQELRIAAITLGAEDVEIRLGVLERF